GPGKGIARAGANCAKGRDMRTPAETAGNGEAFDRAAVVLKDLSAFDALAGRLPKRASRHSVRPPRRDGPNGTQDAATGRGAPRLPRSIGRGPQARGSAPATRRHPPPEPAPA